jgi:hypothetical protein
MKFSSFCLDGDNDNMKEMIKSFGPIIASEFNNRGNYLDIILYFIL